MTPPAPDQRMGRIDTHHHIVPPAYRRWLEGMGLDAGGRALPDWTPAGSLAAMERNGSATAILSLSMPGVHLGDNGEARRLAREVNTCAAEVVAAHPGRFGFFATLTLPDVEGAIAEARHALDHLHADGVVLLSNVGGTYLGDPAWDPLLAELNRRGAVLFEHPSVLPAPAVPGIPPYAADFLLDTTRSAINLVRQGCLERFPDLRILLSHGGGFIPYAAERIAVHCSSDGSILRGMEALRRFHYDTALCGPSALPSLLAFADPQRITFGSDWPFAPIEATLPLVAGLDAFPMDSRVRYQLARGNAEALFPRLAS
ncbi:MAG: amidohydrolase family protein [Cyanobacteriota bacterium]|nr:amidohydrolase family protein [Cyanobacteriota bacterium]